MNTVSKKIADAALHIERGFLEICGIGDGSGYTLQPQATRARVVAMTRAHGLNHLHELADGLAQLAAKDAELFERLVSSRNIVDLNCGAGLSGLLLAVLASEKAAARVFFVDHSKAAVDFAVELAAHLGIAASGSVVEKNFVGAPPGEIPEHNGILTSATLSPAMPALVGPTTIVAGHALSCFKVNSPGNRQSNLQLQNRLVLAQIDKALALDANLTLVDLDIAIYGLTMDDFAAMARAPENIAAQRPLGQSFTAFPGNRTPGKSDKVKYFAVQQLEALTCVDNLVAWPVGDVEILLSESEVEALLGERVGRCEYPGLQQLLAQEVLW
ncbi:MAG: hypothetical protein FJ184_15265 [Gammaproteobacteria bacterium]|nr:hypothetical protein [Gammaproteobacteria bacterium]